MVPPWLHVVPLFDEPSPHLMVYDHGPSLFGSLNDAVSVSGPSRRSRWAAGSASCRSRSSSPSPSRPRALSPCARCPRSPCSCSARR